MNNLFHISFYQPLWFLLGLLIPVLIFWYIKRSKKNKVALAFSMHPALKNAGKTFKQRTVHLPFILRMLALSVFIVAMARPQGFLGFEQKETEGIDIVIALDVSYSMLAQDLSPNRLDAAKLTAIKFIEARKSDRFGLVVFSGEAVSKTPLTLDHDRLIEKIVDLKCGILPDGTAIGVGLATSVARLQKSEAKSKVIILLTDGVNNGVMISPKTGAEMAKSYGIVVYTIGLGTKGMALTPVAFYDNGEPYYDYRQVVIDEPVMKDIAETTGGKYYRATDNSSLDNIFKEIDLMEKSKLETTEVVNKPDLFFWFVLVGALLFLLEIFLRLTYYRSVI